VFNDISFAAAKLASPVDRKETMALPYLTSPAAAFTSLRFMAWFYTGTIAGRAPLLFRNINLLLTAEHSFFKLYREVVTQIIALSVPLLPLCAEEIVEKVIENGIKITPETKIEYRPQIIGSPKSFIPGSLFRVAEHCVSLAYLLERLFGFFVFRISVGVALKGKLSIRLLYLLIGRIFRNIEDFVVINIFSSHWSALFY
jgi:hypothetical protein